MNDFRFVSFLVLRLPGSDSGTKRRRGDEVRLHSGTRATEIDFRFYQFLAFSAITFQRSTEFNSGTCCRCFSFDDDERRKALLF